MDADMVALDQTFKRIQEDARNIREESKLEMAIGADHAALRPLEHPPGPQKPFALKYAPPVTNHRLYKSYRKAVFALKGWIEEADAKAPQLWRRIQLMQEEIPKELVLPIANFIENGGLSPDNIIQPIQEARFPRELFVDCGADTMCSRLAKRIVEYGAEPDSIVCAEDKVTLFHWLMASTLHPNFEMTSYLYQMAPTINLKTSTGATALHLALSRNSLLTWQEDCVYYDRTKEEAIFALLRYGFHLDLEADLSEESGLNCMDMWIRQAHYAPEYDRSSDAANGANDAADGDAEENRKPATVNVLRRIKQLFVDLSAQNLARVQAVRDSYFGSDLPDGIVRYVQSYIHEVGEHSNMEFFHRWVTGIVDEANRESEEDAELEGDEQEDWGDHGDYEEDYESSSLEIDDDDI